MDVLRRNRAAERWGSIETGHREGATHIHPLLLLLLLLPHTELSRGVLGGRGELTTASLVAWPKSQGSQMLCERGVIVVLCCEGVGFLLIRAVQLHHSIYISSTDRKKEMPRQRGRHPSLLMY
ncbi:hypothetical protein MHYP_G00011950 [Metynnis hypsauchen]